MMDVPRLAPAALPAATPFVAADTTLRFLLLLQYLAAHHWMMPPPADANDLCALGQALEVVLQFARLPAATPGGFRALPAHTEGYQGWLEAALPEAGEKVLCAKEHTETLPLTLETLPLAAPLDVAAATSTRCYARFLRPAAPRWLLPELSWLPKHYVASSPPLLLDYFTEEKPTEDSKATGTAAAQYVWVSGVGFQTNACAAAVQDNAAADDDPEAAEAASTTPLRFDSEDHTDEEEYHESCHTEEADTEAPEEEEEPASSNACAVADELADVFENYHTVEYYEAKEEPTLQLQFYCRPIRLLPRGSTLQRRRTYLHRPFAGAGSVRRQRLRRRSKRLHPGLSSQGRPRLCRRCCAGALRSSGHSSTPRKNAATTKLRTPADTRSPPPLQKPPLLPRLSTRSTATAAAEG